MPVPIFCPKCASYIGAQTYCATENCGWSAPDTQALPGVFSPLNPPQPVYSQPAVWQHNGNSHVVWGYGERGMGGAGGLLVIQADSGAAFCMPVGAGVTGGATVVGNRAYFGDEQGRLHCADLISQKVVWTRPTAQNTGAVESPPLVDDARVLVATSKGFVVLASPKDGRDIAPPARLPSRARVSASPTLAGDKTSAFIAAHDGGVYKFDMARRALALVAQTGDSRIYTRPIVLRNKMLVVASYDGRLIEIDPARGTCAELANGLGSIRATPTLSENTLYFGSGNRRLYAFDLKSRKLRVVRDGLPGGLRSPVTVLEGYAYAADTHGAIHAVALADGELRRSYDLGDDRALVPGGVAIANGNLWAGALDGRVHAILPTFGDETWARERAEQGKDWLAVAAFIVRGKEGSPSQREREAAELLANHGQHAEAGAIYQRMGDFTEAAEQFELVGKAERKAIYWRNAAKIWGQLAQVDRAKSCQRTAVELAHQPLLSVELIGIDTLHISSVGHLAIFVQNDMPYKARNIEVSLLSEFFEPCEEFKILELTNRTAPLRCRFRLIPRKNGKPSAILKATYTDDSGNLLDQQWGFDIPVEQTPTVTQTIIQKQFNAPSVINEGDVGQQKFSADGFSPAQMAALMEEFGKLREAAGALANLDERMAALEAIAQAEREARNGRPQFAGRVLGGAGRLVFDLAKGIGANLLTGLIAGGG